MLLKLFKRLWTVVFVLPLAVIFIAFAVANRQVVRLSLDPVAADAPWFAVTTPLFVPIFAALILGVIVGGIAVWLTQGAYRKEARAKKAEAAKLARERDVQKQKLDKLSGVRALPNPASLR
ncbi:MAG: lipopolysaccharide assembly protein LapA domain-containing protein [Pseudomonadota bacterium]